DHRWASYDAAAQDTVDLDDLLSKSDPAVEVTPRYWLPDSEVEKRLATRGWTREWLVGWRDICRSTDERTVIASVLRRTAVGYTCPLFFVELPVEQQVALLANLNSLILDFVARLKIGGTHLTYGYFKQLPVLSSSAYTANNLVFIVPRVLELTYTSQS